MKGQLKNLKNVGNLLLHLRETDVILAFQKL